MSGNREEQIPFLITEAEQTLNRTYDLLQNRHMNLNPVTRNIVRNANIVIQSLIAEIRELQEYVNDVRAAMRDIEEQVQLIRRHVPTGQR